MTKQQPSPTAFMSYTHFDDEHNNRWLTLFREGLSEEVRQHGVEFSIFQDQKNIKVGQKWNDRIKRSLDEVTFLIPIITPNFFESKACCNELKLFLERESELKRNDLILPIYYVSCVLLDDEKNREDNECAKVIAEHQYADWRDLRFEPFNSPQVGRRLEQLAIQICEVLREVLESHPQLKATGSTNSENRSHEGVPINPTMHYLHCFQQISKQGNERQFITNSASYSTNEEVYRQSQQLRCDKFIGESEMATRRPALKNQPQTHFVDVNNNDAYSTISEAIKAADPGDRIIVLPGLYREGLLIDKALEIIGDNDLGEVVVESTGKNTLMFKTNIGRVANLTLRQRTEGYCVDIAQGRLEIEECDIASQSLACVAIHGGADPRMRHCRVHDSAQSGFLVYENGQGSLEDNDIFNNTYAGVEITNHGSPILRCNRIHDNNQSGILIHKNGQGTLEHNEIFSNSFAGIEIRNDGNPLLRYNRIHNGNQSGVLIYDGGGGTLENNEIFSNSYTGISIESGGKPILKCNRVFFNKMAGIYIAQNGLGVLEDNDIFSNTLAGVSIENGGDPILRCNRIYYGKMAGIYIAQNGKGVLEDNDIFGNILAGIAITEGSNPMIHSNHIHDGNMIGVAISENGRGNLEDNDIYANNIGVEITKGGNPILKNNRINRNIREAVCIHDRGMGTIEDNDLRYNGGAWSISADCKKNLKCIRNKE